MRMRYIWTDTLLTCLLLLTNCNCHQAGDLLYPSFYVAPQSTDTSQLQEARRPRGFSEIIHWERHRRELTAANYISSYCMLTDRDMSSGNDV